MKKFYILSLLFFLINSAFANPVITAKQNGSWSSNSTWDKNRKPNHGDTIIIPSGRIVLFDNVFTTESLQNVYIKVYGTLRLAGILSFLSLDNQSTVIIYSGGNLNSAGWVQNISLGGNPIFATSQPPITGPQIANSGTNGFVAISNPLPVKFIGFTVTLKAKDALIQWSTTEEINARVYEVERSTDGSNWSTIADIAAAGNSTLVRKYSYTDKNITSAIAYYRIKEIDFDGAVSFTSIKMVKPDAVQNHDEIKIASIQNKVLLQFSGQVKGTLLVRFVSLNGQVMDQQIINNPTGQVVLNSKLRGSYIISVSNRQDINAARQVIL